MTNSALKRINGHRAKASWMDEIASVGIEWFDTRNAAHEAERAAIQIESPKHNRILYRPKPVRRPTDPANDAIPRQGPDRKSRKIRLERAGYACLKDVWVPAVYAAHVLHQVKMHREDVERILAEPPKPRGRPKKEA